MNHCRKCESDYAKPGTCNCFAATMTGRVPDFAEYMRGYADGQRAAQGWAWVQPYPWYGAMTVTTDSPAPTWTLSVSADQGVQS